jgi:RND family efflux transporter MFP subunit
MTNPTRLTSCVVALMVSLAPTIGCDRPAAPSAGAAPRGAPVEVALARSTVGAVDRTIDVVGTLFGDEEAQLSAKAAGEIVAVHKDVGDEISAGEPLAQIDPVTYRLQRDQARLSLEQAMATLGLTEAPTEASVNIDQVPTVVQKRLQSENAIRRYERAQQLFSGTSGSISEQEYTDLRTAAEVARSEYEVERLEAQSQLADVRVRQSELRVRDQRLADTTVRAPGAGDAESTRNARRYVVTARQVSLGEYVREGTAMFRVVADDPIKYRAGVPERFLAQVRPGQAVRLRVDGRDEAFTGRLTRVNPQIDPTSRTFQVEAVFENPNRTLRAGQFARGSIVVGTEASATFVPREAVVSFAGVVRVFTVSDGKAVEHRVTTGQRVGGAVEIVQGLSGEHEVVVRGGSRLSNGAPVIVAPALQPSTAAPAGQ